MRAMTPWQRVKQLLKLKQRCARSAGRVPKPGPVRQGSCSVPRDGRLDTQNRTPGETRSRMSKRGRGGQAACYRGEPKKNVLS